MKKKTFEVKISSTDGKKETVYVKAKDAWQARTISMFYCTTKWCDSMDPLDVPKLSYDVTEASND